MTGVVGSGGEGGREALAAEGRSEGGREGGALGGEGGDGVRGVEDEAELGARDGGTRCEDDEGEVGGLDGPLETIPVRAGDAAEVGRGGVAEIEDDEAEVGIAREEIGGLEGEGRRSGIGRTTDPEKMGEEIGRKRIGIEGVGGVDQADARAGGTGDGEELAEEELAAAARGGADDFGDGAEREAAAGGVVNRRETGGEGAPGRPRGGGEALREQMPERRELVGRG